MKTAQEIEAELTVAAERMRDVLKAAKDQSARQTGEPADLPRGVPGAVTPAPAPNIPTR